MKKVAILQSSFLPWKGYFDIANSVDQFVFFDCVQFTKRDWRTRNYIKTPDGVKLINIPVNASTSLSINKITIERSQKWELRTKKAFEFNYRKAPFFDEFSFILDKLFENQKWLFLSNFNQFSIKYLSNILGIKTEFIDSKKLNLEGTKTDRLIDALTKLNADIYLSGPSAQDYIEEEKFRKEGIQLDYMDYSNYPEYPQLWGDFEHKVSILDLIFSVGQDAPYYIWGWRD